MRVFHALSFLAILFFTPPAFSQATQSKHKAEAAVAVARAKILLQAPVPPQAPVFSSQLSGHAGISGSAISVQPVAKIKSHSPNVGWSPTCLCDEGLRCICGPACPCPAPTMQQDHGWTDLGGGYQQHTSGYYYHPSHGVYWPEPVQPVAQPMFQPMPMFGGFGGFGGDCVGGT